MPVTTETSSAGPYSVSALYQANGPGISGTQPSAHLEGVTAAYRRIDGTSTFLDSPASRGAGVVLNDANIEGVAVGSTAVTILQAPWKGPTSASCSPTGPGERDGSSGFGRDDR